MEIAVETFADSQVIDLLKAHLADMYATSPPESVHALNIDELKAPDITFWSARSGNKTLGCIALKRLNQYEAEIKSMRTDENARGKGVATALLDHLIREAKSRGLRELLLETGSMEFFAPARRLYERNGFTYCAPFGGYSNDPNSVFMQLKL